MRLEKRNATCFDFKLAAAVREAAAVSKEMINTAKEQHEGDNGKQKL